MIDAAGKKAKAEASCYAKALQKGLPVDTNCIQKAIDAFNKSFTKAQAKGDCLVSDLDVGIDRERGRHHDHEHDPDGDQRAAGSGSVLREEADRHRQEGAEVHQLLLEGREVGVQVDDTCGQKAASSFNGSLKACGTPTQPAPLEGQIDAFGIALTRAVTVPTTTTSTTTTSTTTTTSPPPLGQHLSFTTAVGTSNCTISVTGDPTTSTPLPPFSGELDSDTVGTKITDLGLGCLYIGGGAATVAPSLHSGDATTVLDSPDGTTLAGSLGTSRADCSVGPQGSTKHCINNPGVDCSSDAECFAPGACQLDPTCYFGPPVLVNGFPSSCVVNAFSQNASGTLNVATGESTVDIELASLVYLTLGKPSVCPMCDNGSGTCNYGVQVNFPCTTNNSTGTTLDCLPDPGTFVATLPISLNPLTSSPITTTAADGLFCPGQANPGAFGQATTQVITQNGSPAGDLTDGLPHSGVLVSSFCIPPTGSLALDGIADLPGPGSLSLPGNAQSLHVSIGGLRGRVALPARDPTPGAGPRPAPGHRIRRSRFVLKRGILAGVLTLAALVSSAPAAVIPPPIAPFINFDDMPGATDVLSIPGPLTTEVCRSRRDLLGLPSPERRRHPRHRWLCPPARDLPAELSCFFSAPSRC